jgi:hypothetical protein
VERWTKKNVTMVRLTGGGHLYLKTACNPKNDLVRHIRGNCHHPSDRRGRGPQSRWLYEAATRGEMVCAGLELEDGSPVWTEWFSLSVPRDPTQRKLDEAEG